MDSWTQTMKLHHRLLLSDIRDACDHIRLFCPKILFSKLYERPVLLDSVLSA
eukprot:m.209896 g.209896  ORF g.209896 m.209896 type:complete len:52 (+) comp18998_c0_seq15:2856-3011(+)